MQIRPLGFLDESLYWGRSGKQATVLEMRCVLAKELDAEVLKDALLGALRVHTNFRTRPLLIKRRFHAMTDAVKHAPLIKEDGRPRRLGTAETEGLMLYVSYGKSEFTLHVFHGIADLRSVYAFLHTLMRFYCHGLGVTKIVLPDEDSIDTFSCYEEILKHGAPGKPGGMINPETLNVFHLPEKGFGDKTTKQRLFEIDLPLKPFLEFARANKSSVVPSLNAVIGRAIRQSYEVGEKDIVCYIPIDLRPVFHFKSGGNGTTNFVLRYSEKMDQYEAGDRAIHLRTDMNTQIRPENLYASVASLREKFDKVYSNPLPIGLLSRIVVRKGRQMDVDSYTYGISYVGNVNFEENIDPYVTSVTACAGSYSYPLWIIACEYNGIIRMKLIQSYDSDMLAKNIYLGLSELIPGTGFTDLGYHDFDEFPLKAVPRKRYHQ